VNKTVVTVALFTLLAVLCCRASAEDPKKPAGKAIMIEIRLVSEVEGKRIEIRPRVMTVEGKTAKVTVGNVKTELNGQVVDGGKGSPENPSSAQIEITPSIVEKGAQPAVRMAIKFTLYHNGYTVRQDFQNTDADGAPFTYETKDSSRKQRMELVITPKIQADK